MYENLFSKAEVGGIELKNRVTMPPMYVGYAGKGGFVSPMCLEHYELMAKSGASMIVVESSSIDHPAAGGGARTIRADSEEFLDGLSKLASTIKDQGAVAAIQLNHAGKFSVITEPLAPSNYDGLGLGRTFKEMDSQDIAHVRDKFAQSALLAKKAGFDIVELHGGTGYLLSQFVSPWANKRTDEYGGSPENRRRFPLEVLAAVKDAVGDMPVGYRFLADEWLPQGLTLEESLPFAAELDRAGAAYLSVMAGTWESFMTPDALNAASNDAYMADIAAAVKKEVSIPVIAAGRMSTGAIAEKVLEDGAADLIGIARPLWADPQWVTKAREGRDDEINQCRADCGYVCMQLVMAFKPAYCKQWSAEKKAEWKAKYQ